MKYDSAKISAEKENVQNAGFGHFSSFLRECPISSVKSAGLMSQEIAESEPRVMDDFHTSFRAPRGRCKPSDRLDNL